jgi:BA14K-like protein
MNLSSKILTVALMAATAPWLVAPAAAAPLSSPPQLQNAVLQNAEQPPVETVQYRRGWRGGDRGGGFGGVGLGLAAGAIIGGAIVGATRPYGYYGYSGYDSDYGYAPSYGPGYAAPDPYAAGGEVAYCQQRFRSYDPGSGTYLGFDGLRHPCP